MNRNASRIELGVPSSTRPGAELMAGLELSLREAPSSDLIVDRNEMQP
jgi:hypothetical protein